ncbi:Ig-like domain-containing protein [Candidatus Halobeggiatoa sp. HSG11]|nr:Ig-like domain-containing protein [Candidatus Halobeggiatoa sp. HSG11]
MRFLTQWLILIFTLALLNACGGGSDEPSNFFDDTGGNVGGDAVDTSNQITDITIIPSIGPRLVTSGGRTTINFTTIGNEGARAGELAPNVPLTITVHPEGTARLENAPTSSDHRGNVNFSVSHPGSGTVFVNVSGGNGVNGGFDIPIYFGASVTADIISNDNIAPADGVTPTDIKIIARDAYGTGLSGIPVGFTFPLDSFAVPNVIGATNEVGEITVGITNTIPQTTKVTPFAGGMTAGPLNLDFTSGQIAANPTSLDLIVKSNNVRPDGTKAILIVMARDDSGSPVPYVPVSISSNSATAQLNIGDKSNSLFINGNTGKEGSFELNITNTIAETVNITATTNSGSTTDSTVINVQQDVIFSNTGVGENSQITTVELDQALNSPQLANGTDPVYLRGRVLDQDGKPIANQTITIIVSGGSATIVMDNDGKTDSSGRFLATLTDQFPEQFSATAVAGGISSSEVQVSFTGTGSNNGVGGGRVTLLASPNMQIANGENAITLTAIVRDNNNTPLKDIQVSISANSNTAIFDKGTATTGESGTATFSLTNTSTENFNVTVNAQGSTSSTNVRFIGSSGDVTILDTNVTNNNQLANGNDKIRIDVVAKDNNGNLIGGVPISVGMSAGIAAKAEPAQGATDINGSFFTEISSTEAGQVNVTIKTNNIAQNETIAFQASTDGIIPSTIDLQVTNNAQLANGEDKINLVIIPRDANNNPLVGTSIRLIADAPDVVIEPESGATNEIGKFFATVASTREQQFNITAVVEGMAEPKGVASLIFNSIGSEVKELNVNVVRNHQLATGQDGDSAQINIIARNTNGLPVSGVPINVQLLNNPAATVQFDSPFTDTKGLFIAKITSTSAGDIKTKITVAGVNTNVPPQERNITFIASGEVTPAKVDISLEGSVSPKVNSLTTLLVVPRDKNNAPIPNLEITLASNSGTAVFEPDGGATNQLGEFRTNITSTAVETIEVTATAKGVHSEKLPITFGTGVGSLVVTVFNDNQLANGTDIIEVHVVARDNAGMAVPNVPIAIQLPSTAAVADTSFNEGKTDASGFFKSNIISTVAGEIAVTISVKGTNIAAPPKLINFRADGGTAATPKDVELIVSGTAVADGKSEIDLLITPRDNSGNPLAGVTIELLKDSDDVVIAETTGTTNALGEFRTTVTTIPGIVGGTLTEALVVNITPIANGVVGKSVVAIFTPPSVPRAGLTLTVSNNNPQLDEDVTITISARDENGFAVKNIPVRLRVEPVGTPDVTGSVIFGKFEGKTSEDNGIFTTTIRNNQTGTVKVIATMLNREGGEPIAVNSSPVNITFQTEGILLQEVTEINLITDSSTLKSEGKTEGIILTAIVKDKDNHLVKNAEVDFEANSGNLQLVDNNGNPVVESITDDNGRAYARLTTVGNADNRDIRVIASVASMIADPITNEKTRKDEIIIQVVGTTITISGSRSIVQFEEETLTISLRDSDNKPIANQLLRISSELNNSFNSVDGTIDITTDTNGQARVVFTANNPGTGEDIIKVSKPNASGVQTSTHVITISDDTLKVISDSTSGNLCPDVTSIDEDTNNNGILDIDLLEDVNGNGILDLGCRILLNQEQSFEVTWQKGGSPVFNEINLSATRGILSSSSITMNQPDQPARFTINSNNAGPATIIVNGNRASPPGPTLQFEIKFIAEKAQFVNVQANPSVIGTNPVGTDNERSEILAVVRDPNNNLVADKQVNFLLNDISGGKLTRGSAFTDDFGRATTEYIAGSSSSAANGVQITASVADNSTISSSVNLTVAEKDLFVKLGSGNTLEGDGIRYKVYHTVLVTDSNGTPVSDAEVILSIYPLTYTKQSFEIVEESIIYGDSFSCPNEDVNRNGILDLNLNEDVNNNNQIDPGNVVTVDKLKLITDSSGFADFNVVYAIQYARWVNVEITARTEVAGTESSDTLQISTICSIEDVTKQLCPRANPFGAQDCHQPN